MYFLYFCFSPANAILYLRGCKNMHDVFREGFAVTELNVISGFLGSGKTTLIRHLTQRMSRDKTIAVIENDFGEVGLDAELLRQGSVVVSEINSGCVCCSLTGNLRESLASVLRQYAPDVIFLEPSGVARLSEVRNTLDRLCGALPLTPGSILTLAAPQRRTAYTAKFSGIYLNQIRNAGVVLPTHTENLPAAERQAFVRSLFSMAEGVPVLAEDWQELDAERLLPLGAVSSFACSADLHSRFLSGQSAQFSSVSVALPERTSEAAVRGFLAAAASDEERFGALVRSKGFFADVGGTVKVDFADGETVFERVGMLAKPRLVLIGYGLDKDAILALAAEKFGE